MSQLWFLFLKYVLLHDDTLAFHMLTSCIKLVKNALCIEMADKSTSYVHSLLVLIYVLEFLMYDIFMYDTVTLWFTVVDL